MENAFPGKFADKRSLQGVLTVLEKLGLDVGSRDVESYRRYFDGLTIEEYIDKVLELAGISSLVMTNDPFVNDERIVWERGIIGDSRFKAALRIDPLLNNWEISGAKLKEWGMTFRLNPTERLLMKYEGSFQIGLTG